MVIFVVTRTLVALLSISSVSIAQVPDDLPINDATRQYFESLPPEKLTAILKIFQQALAGQVPASPKVIETQELYWSNSRSLPFFPTC